MRSRELINYLLRCVNQWVGEVVAAAAEVVGVDGPEHHAAESLLHGVQRLRTKDDDVINEQARVFCVVPPSDKRSPGRRKRSTPCHAVQPLKRSLRNA